MLSQRLLVLEGMLSNSILFFLASLLGASYGEEGVANLAK